MTTPHHRLALSIPTPQGNLEGKLFYQEEGQAGAGVLICPPHPLLAGNMENNVVQAVAAECLAAGFPVLLFNYRAVGKSFHPRQELPLFEYWNGLDRKGNFQEIIDDTRDVLAFAWNYLPAIHLVGYSFGAYIALQLCSNETASYTAISPPLAEHDFSPLAGLTAPCLLIEAQEENLLTSASLPPATPFCTRKTIADTDHFFLGREPEVGRLVRAFLQIRQ